MSTNQQNLASAARRAAKRALSKPLRFCKCGRTLTGDQSQVCSLACRNRFKPSPIPVLKGEKLTMDISDFVRRGI